MVEGTSQLGKYRLLGRIGHGGMAEVWVAHQQGPMGFAKLVAIKRLLPHMENEQQFVHMFLDEARIAARINHANVVQIFDLGQVEQSFFIAMEYLDGESMARVMGEGIKRGKPLPVSLATYVVSQMCTGLHHAHALKDTEGKALGLVHRDVSPQNVMVLYDGGVKLLDFGIAKAKERLTETTTSGMKGKYAYMSPEQCQGLSVDPRSDIFSCGIVLWEALTRRRLFKHPSKLMILKMITEGRVPPPSKLNPEVPAEVDEVALRALCKLPGERFSSAKDMSVALDRASSRSGVGAGAADLADYMQGVFGDDQERRAGWISTASSSPKFLESLHTSEYFLDLIPDSTTVISFSKSSVGTSVGRRVPRQSPIWWILTAVIATLAAVAAVILLLLAPPAPEAEGSRLHVESSPPGAMIVIDGRLQQKRTPGIVEQLEPGKHQVEVVLDGHVAWQRSITLRQGETLRVEASLPPQVVPDASVDSTVDGAAPRVVHGRADAGRRPDARVAAAGADMSGPLMVVNVKRRPAEHGELNLVTRPWATVYHGARRLGNTPLVRAKLPTGTVKLRAINREAGINMTFTVRIEKDKLTRKIVDLK